MVTIYTVKELFEQFNFIPEAIVYYDKLNNIQDVEYFEKNPHLKFLSFLEEYGERELTDFQVDGIEKTIHIEFS